MLTRRPRLSRRLLQKGLGCLASVRGRSIPLRLQPVPANRLLRALTLGLLGLGLGLGPIGTASADDLRAAPNAGAVPFNQLRISGNACGPGAILSSFRSGSPKWQSALELVPGADDRETLSRWIRTYGLRPSATLKGRNRWTNAGINVDDLVIATNEMTRARDLPQVAQESLFLRGREDPADLVRRTHARLATSLAKGIPPVLSLRRFALRGGHWTPIQGHFVTVVAVPEKLKRGETGFTFTYLDPWGGKRSQGAFRLPVTPVLAGADGRSPCLEAAVPAANIGKSEVRRGETTVVVPAALIGRW